MLAPAAADAPGRKVPISRQIIDDPAGDQARQASRSLEFLERRIGAAISVNRFAEGSADYLVEQAGAEMWRRYLARGATTLDPYWDHPVESPLIRDRSVSAHWRSPPQHVRGYTSLIEGEYLWGLILKSSPAPGASVAVLAPSHLVEPIRDSLLAEALSYKDPHDAAAIFAPRVSSCLREALTISALTHSEMAQWRLSQSPLDEKIHAAGHASGQGWRSSWGLNGGQAVIYHELAIPGGYLVAREMAPPWELRVRHYTTIPMLQNFAAALKPASQGHRSTRNSNG